MALADLWYRKPTAELERWVDSGTLDDDDADEVINELALRSIKGVDQSSQYPAFAPRDQLDDVHNQPEER